MLLSPGLRVLNNDKEKAIVVLEDDESSSAKLRLERMFGKTLRKRRLGLESSRTNSVLCLEQDLDVYTDTCQKAAPLFPVFLKFHKVGSTSIRMIFECLSQSRGDSLAFAVTLRPELAEMIGDDVAKFKPTMAMIDCQTYFSHPGTAADRLDGAPFLKLQDMLLTNFATDAVAERLSQQLLNKQVPHLPFDFRTFTVMRHPVDKFVSSVLYFWTKPPKTMVGDKLQQIRNQMKKGLTPGFLGKEEVELMLNHTTGGLNFAHEELAELSHIGNAPHRNPPHRNKNTKFDKNRIELVERKSNRRVEPYVPTDKDLLSAKRNLRDQFIVGVTEDMPSFLVLLSMELGWPLDAMCYLGNGKTARINVPQAANAHRNTKYGPFFSEEGTKFLESVLAKDIELYEYAARLHAKQLQWHTARGERDVKDLLDQFSSYEFQEHCKNVTTSVLAISEKEFHKEFITNHHTKYLRPKAPFYCRKPLSSLPIWRGIA